MAQTAHLKVPVTRAAREGVRSQAEGKDKDVGEVVHFCHTLKGLSRFKLMNKERRHPGLQDQDETCAGRHGQGPRTRDPSLVGGRANMRASKRWEDCSIAAHLDVGQESREVRAAGQGVRREGASAR